MGIGEKFGDVYSEGGFGGRVPTDLEESLKFCISDIQNAINRKAKKLTSYGISTELWIYPNSISSGWLSGYWYHPENIEKLCAHSYENISDFKRVIIFWKSEMTSIIHP